MATSGRRRRRGGLITEINVTPLVDIMLVLLIIFMLTAELIHARVIGVDLPHASKTAEGKPRSLTVALAADGSLLVDGRPMSPEAVDAVAREALAADPKAVVVLAGDRRTPHGRVVWLLDRLRGLGITHFDIQVDRAELDRPTAPKSTP